jgi:hypothetical protein
LNLMLVATAVTRLRKAPGTDGASELHLCRRVLQPDEQSELEQRPAGDAKEERPRDPLDERKYAENCPVLRPGMHNVGPALRFQRPVREVPWEEKRHDCRNQLDQIRKNQQERHDAGALEWPGALLNRQKRLGGLLTPNDGHHITQAYSRMRQGRAMRGKQVRISCVGQGGVVRGQQPAVSDARSSSALRSAWLRCRGIVVSPSICRGAGARRRTRIKLKE